MTNTKQGNPTPELQEQSHHISQPRWWLLRQVSFVFHTINKNDGAA